MRRNFQFYKKKSTKDGYRYDCIACSKLYKELNKERDKERNKIYNDSRKDKQKGYYNENKEEFKNRNKLNYENNKEYIKERNREYSIKNRERRNSYLKNRKEKDSLFKLTVSLRGIIYKTMKRNGCGKNSRTTEILGISFEEFKIHIENQFTQGMSWENHGEWHLDHKTPVSWATNEKETYELNHYTNFQPLWGTENMSKGNRYSD
jgi:hypothetical protein